MKFLHLSDLHIGKNLDNISMIPEQKHALRQIIDYIKIHNPVAVVIAGDIYDRTIPSVEAVGVFDDFLTELAALDIVVMIIAGNHDSPERLNFASRLLSDKKLFICGTFDGSIRNCVLSDEYGEVNFWLLPFIKPTSLRRFFNESYSESHNKVENHEDAVAAALDRTNINHTSRNVLISHQFYTKVGLEPKRSDSEVDPIGGLDSVNARLIENFDYAALGHLHGAQSVGAPHIRYSGSFIKYSFSEWLHKKSVTLVELKEKGDLTIIKLPITPIHNMRVIKGKLEHLISDEVISSLEEADKEDYLKVILTDEIVIDPMAKLRRFYPNILKLSFDNSRTNIDMSAITSSLISTDLMSTNLMSTDLTSTNLMSTKQVSPYDLFEEFFLNTQGYVMNKEQREIVQKLLEQQDNENQT